MAKVATLTFQNADNYGAVLQCYALQQAIQRLGAETEVLDYQSRYFSRPWGLAALRRKGVLRFVLGNVNALLRLPRHKAFQNFRKRVRFSEPLRREELPERAALYDRFITGSDQVWNYELTDFDTTYFLDFVKDREKKYSYAASIGHTRLPPEYQKPYADFLRDFQRVTAREDSASELIQALSGRKSETVLDPVLLLGADDWRTVAESSGQRSPYIFLYQLSPSRRILETVRNIRAGRNLPVIAVPFAMGALSGVRCNLRCGPEKWLGYIRDAEYVVTDSFHASAFSILFQKQAYICLNEAATRLRCMLETFQLENLIVDASDPRRREPVDYAAAFDILARKREESLRILGEMIGG